MFTESVMASSYFIICHPILLPSSIFPSIKQNLQNQVILLKLPILWIPPELMSPFPIMKPGKELERQTRIRNISLGTFFFLQRTRKKGMDFRKTHWKFHTSTLIAGLQDGAGSSAALLKYRKETAPRLQRSSWSLAGGGDFPWTRV